MVDLNTTFRIGFTMNQAKLEDMLSFASTTLTLAANAGAGATSVYVGGGADANIGDESTWIVIDPYTNQCEIRLVTGITAQPDNTQKLDVRALAYAHVDGDSVFVLREPVILPQWFGVGSDTNMLRMAFAQVYAGEITHVVIPPGEYTLTQGINVLSGTQVDGYGAVLIAAATLADNAYILNATSRRDIVIRGLEVDGDAIVNIETKGIRFNTACSNILVEDCYIHGNFQYGLRINGAGTDITFNRCRVSGCYEHGIFASAGIQTRVKVHNCYVTGCGLCGILLNADAVNTYDCEIIDCEAHSNSTTGNASAGIEMWTDAGRVGVHYRPTIRGCKATNNRDNIDCQNWHSGVMDGNQVTLNVYDLGNGISLWYSTYCKVANNVVTEVKARGIECKTVNYSSITGNTVVNPNTANTLDDGGAPPALVYIGGIDLISSMAGGCQYNTITGNVVGNVGATGHAQYGIGELILNGVNLSNYNQIADNILMGNEELGVWWNGAQTKVRDNRGFATEGRGSGSMQAGDTQVVIAHGLDHTPNIADISVRWGGNPVDSDILWVSAVDATNITIDCDVDPFANTPVFWHARICNQS